MAKSSRSKWKKQHRRQKAKEEAVNTVKRIKQLHRKLELTIKGGISAVPPQEPEKRFHFLNPELDPRVPNTRKDLNNNYRAELNHVHYDYAKPLKLAPPKTNVYGKSDTTAPHPMTLNYETLDADAPLGGHAQTKVDVERMARRQLEEAAAAAAAEANANEEEEAVDTSAVEAEAEDSDGPEEFVFGMDDAAPRRASKAATKAKKSPTTTLSKKKKSSAAAGSSSSAVTAAAAAAMAAVAEEDAVEAQNHGSKIASMQLSHKKNGVTVSAGGASKMKKVGSRDGASGTRVVSSGGKAAQKKTGKRKIASK